MNLAATIELLGYGTSEGAVKGWDARGRGRHPEWANDVHLTFFKRSKHPNQYWVSSKKFFQNSVPESAERERVARSFLKAKETGTETVQGKDLIPMQSSLSVVRIERAKQGLADEALAGKLPAVFRFQGKQYVMDGHHRLAYESGSGLPSKARIFE